MDDKKMPDKSAKMTNFTFADGSSAIAEDQIEGILINPLLPPDFYSTPVAERSQAHMERWYQVPFILHTVWDTDLSPTGHQYEVRCLDEASIYQPSIWGVFVTLEEALTCAMNRPESKHRPNQATSAVLPMFVSTNAEFERIRGSVQARYNLLMRSIRKHHRLLPDSNICSGCSQDLTYLVFTGQVECCFADGFNDEALLDD
jgi:hypothetical protein